MKTLEDFESALQNEYSCEVEFTHSNQLQQVIDYCHFSLIDLSRFFKGHIMFGNRSGFLKDSNLFLPNVWTVSTMIMAGHKQMRFVYCEDNRSQVPIECIVAFPFEKEKLYYEYLCRLERLRAFL